MGKVSPLSKTKRKPDSEKSGRFRKTREIQKKWGSTLGKVSPLSKTKRKPDSEKSGRFRKIRSIQKNPGDSEKNGGVVWGERRREQSRMGSGPGSGSDEH